MIGTILRQRYKIIQQLGVGGIGETYLAEDLDIPVSPNPKCVVKRLHPRGIDPDIQRLFQKETAISALTGILLVREAAHFARVSSGVSLGDRSSLPFSCNSCNNSCQSGQTEPARRHDRDSS